MTAQPACLGSWSHRFYVPLTLHVPPAVSRQQEELTGCGGGGLAPVGAPAVGGKGDTCRAPGSPAPPTALFPRSCCLVATEAPFSSR